MPVEKRLPIALAAIAAVPGVLAWLSQRENTGAEAEHQEAQAKDDKVSLSE